MPSTTSEKRRTERADTLTRLPLDEEDTSGSSPCGTISKPLLSTCNITASIVAKHSSSQLSLHTSGSSQDVGSEAMTAASGSSSAQHGILFRSPMMMGGSNSTSSMQLHRVPETSILMDFGQQLSMHDDGHGMMGVHAFDHGHGGGLLSSRLPSLEFNHHQQHPQSSHHQLHFQQGQHASDYGQHANDYGQHGHASDYGQHQGGQQQQQQQVGYGQNSRSHHDHGGVLFEEHTPMTATTATLLMQPYSTMEGDSSEYSNHQSTVLDSTGHGNGEQINNAQALPLLSAAPSTTDARMSRRKSVKYNSSGNSNNSSKAAMGGTTGATTSNNNSLEVINPRELVALPAHLLNSDNPPTSTLPSLGRKHSVTESFLDNDPHDLASLSKRRRRSMVASSSTTTASNTFGAMTQPTISDWMSMGMLVPASQIQQGREDDGRRTSVMQRNFVCPFPGCFNAFINKGHLDRHLRIHTKEKPYACPLPICGKRFTRLDNMKQHYKSHAKNGRNSKDKLLSKLGLAPNPGDAEGNEMMRSMVNMDTDSQAEIDEHMRMMAALPPNSRDILAAAGSSSSRKMGSMTRGVPSAMGHHAMMNDMAQMSMHQQQQQHHHQQQQMHAQQPQPAYLPLPPLSKSHTVQPAIIMSNNMEAYRYNDNSTTYGQHAFVQQQQFHAGAPPSLGSGTAALAAFESPQHMVQSGEAMVPPPALATEEELMAAARSSAYFNLPSN